VVVAMGNPRDVAACAPGVPAGPGPRTR